MLGNMNLSEARRESVEPGAYVMVVKKVYIDQKYDRLVLDLDIAEGPKAGYYTRLNDRAGFWGLSWSLYLSKDDAWKFANAIDAFRGCNSDFAWNDDGENDEQTLVGRRIGMITRHKEYMGNDGILKKKLVTYKPISLEDVRTGNFTIPEPILYKEGATQMPEAGSVVDTTASNQPDPVEGFKNTSDDEIPF